MADGRADEPGTIAPRLVTAQLAHFAAERAVRVHDALGVGGRARRVADDRGSVGVHVEGAIQRLGRMQPVEGHQVGRATGVADDEDGLEVAEAVADGGELGQVITLAVGRDGDEGARPALAEDEADFLRPVEVHDGHDRHAQRCCRRRR